MGTFKDSLKKWFFQQGSKTPTSSTLIPTIDGASGNNQGFPNGYTTIANLASVLGGITSQLPNNGNVLSLANPRIFWTIGGSTYSYENTPWTNGSSENYALFIRLGDDSHSVLFTMSANVNKVFFNIKYDITWKGWKSVDLT